MTAAAIDLEEALRLLEQAVAGYRAPVVDLVAAQTRDPFKILVATILSARTRDEITARACRRLFDRIRGPADLEAMDEAELADLIAPVGFYRNKARYLKALPRVLAERFAGRVPETVEGLLQLPGVGRKTATLVAGVAFGVPAICVDTHVHRIANIWGVVRTTTPAATEKALETRLDRRYWIRINQLLVAHGQAVCRPRRPRCHECVVAHLCPRIGVTPARAPGDAGAESSGVLRLFSWNVNGLRAAWKKGFADWFHELRPDILLLQEVKALPDQLPDGISRFPGVSAYWFPAEKKGYAGTGILTRCRPLEVRYGLGLAEFDREGRVLTLEFPDFFLVNAYFPNAQPGLRRLAYKLAFNRALLEYLEGLAWKKAVVLGGDLNVAHRPIDLARPEANEEHPGYSSAERAWMDELVDRAGFVDTFRWCHGQSQRFTWWSYRGGARARNVGWRLDYFLVDAGARDRIAGADILEEVTGSDHCPVVLEWRCASGQAPEHAGPSSETDV